MFLSFLADLVVFIVRLLKIPLILICLFLLYLLVFVVVRFLVALKKGHKFRKGTRKRVRLPSWWKKLFWQFPLRFSDDLLNSDPDFFRHQGLVIFEGRQGRGKTVAETEFIRRMQREYPLSKCLTNYGYKYQNVELKHWKQLISYKNGKYGVIVGIDETQNWFSSNDSKNFPPEMLEVVTQNRKNRRIIVGTSQSFYLLAKAIRTQTVEVRTCFTLCGCITFVRRREPVLDSTGEVIEWKNRGFYWFVHDKDLRNSYDTYRVVENLARSGFQDKKDAPDVVVNSHFTVSK